MKSDIFLKSGQLVLLCQYIKKGDKKKPENYRGITSTVHRVKCLHTC